jgi:hypothetical protein
MPNQTDSPDGKPRTSSGRPSPDVDSYATDGQSNARGKGASTQQGDPPPRAGEQPGQQHSHISEGDGPGKPGLTSDKQQNLVSPSGVNEGDHGAADDKPMGGGSVNLDEDDLDRPRGNTARTGGTSQAQGGDSGQLGHSPGPGLSDRNGPSDPASRRGRS